MGWELGAGSGWRALRCAGAGFGLGLKLVSATRLRSHGWLLAAGQPDQAGGCAWNLGWAGAELCLGGLLDGQGLCHTHLGLSGWRVGWAGPEASRRHVRHASRRAEGGPEALKTGLGLG